jgi:hypothetical protein
MVSRLTGVPSKNSFDCSRNVKRKQHKGNIKPFRQLANVQIHIIFNDPNFISLFIPFQNSFLSARKNQDFPYLASLLLCMLMYKFSFIFMHRPFVAKSIFYHFSCGTVPTINIKNVEGKI